MHSNRHCVFKPSIWKRSNNEARLTKYSLVQAKLFMWSPIIAKNTMFYSITGFWKIALYLLLVICICCVEIISKFLETQEPTIFLPHRPSITNYQLTERIYAYQEQTERSIVIAMIQEMGKKWRHDPQTVQNAKSPTRKSSCNLLQKKNTNTNPNRESITPKKKDQ